MWTEEAESDLGLALIEWISYVGDLLANYQEQIAAEARLTTRRRFAAVLGVIVVFILWRRCRATHTFTGLSSDRRPK